jgi:imidazoleglycerol-phosphate dehydratase
MKPRTASCSRKTKETDIRVDIDLDRPGKIVVDSGIGFFNHLLEAAAFHGRFSLSVRARGDLEVDFHHLVEDTGLVLGDALRQAAEERGDFQRFGHSLIPMDDALSEVSVDAGGRPYLVFSASFPQARCGDFEMVLIREFLVALTNRARITVHALLRHGQNSHHCAESLFKALGRALHQAYGPPADATAFRGAGKAGSGQNLSTKGTIL